MAARTLGTIDSGLVLKYWELRALSLMIRFNQRPMPFGWTVSPCASESVSNYRPLR